MHHQPHLSSATHVLLKEREINTVQYSTVQSAEAATCTIAKSGCLFVHSSPSPPPKCPTCGRDHMCLTRTFQFNSILRFSLWLGGQYSLAHPRSWERERHTNTRRRRRRLQNQQTRRRADLPMPMLLYLDELGSRRPRSVGLLAWLA
jgi:hypothetical protein